MFKDEKTQNVIYANLNSSVSHGTMHHQDLIPVFMNVIRDAPEYLQVMNIVPSYVQDDESAEWWDGEDAHWLLIDLMEALERYAPEGYYFGSHPGDGSDYGYWQLTD